MKATKQIVTEVAEKYQADLQKHARDDYSMRLLLEIALADAISLALRQHIEPKDAA